MSGHEIPSVSDFPVTNYYGLDAYFKPNGPYEPSMFPSQLDIEKYCFYYNWPEEKGGLGKAEHFWNISDIMFNRGDEPMMIRTEWAEKMIEEACNHEYLAIAGCASSGKSHTMAAWGLVNWFASPEDTKVIMTSTTLKAAKKRIWGSVERLWYACPGLPGKYIKSQGQIVAVLAGGQTLDTAGLELIACEKSQEEKSISNVIGMKAKNFIVVGDELSEIPGGILKAYKANLNKNPNSQFVGISNPSSRFDTFGDLATPKGGWKSVTESDYEWRTELGFAVRFDAELSPNVKAGREIVPRLPTIEMVRADRELHGPTSPDYYRMTKGWFPPAGAESGIYSEYDIIEGGCMDKVVWKGQPDIYVGLDPAFTSGGDRSCLVALKCGYDTSNKEVIQVDDIVFLDVDATNSQPETQQIVGKLKDYCLDRNIHPSRVAFDATGGGISFGHVLTERWSPSVTGVHFSSAASNRQVSDHDERLACEVYYNKAAELWYGAKNLIADGRIKGMGKSLINEMTGRQYKSKGSERKILVESKKEYKKRLKSSPDIADAFFIALEIVKSKSEFGAIVDKTGKSTINNDEYHKISFNINNDIYGDMDLDW